VKNQKTRWIALTVLASLVVAAAGYFLLISPKRSDVSSVKAAAVTQEGQADQLRTKLAVLRAQQKNLVTQQAALKAAAVKIPTTPDLPALLRQLSTAATTAGVSFDSLTPAPPTKLDAAPGISSIALNLSVTGDYANLEQYIYQLENLDRAFLVTGFSVAPSTSSSATTTTDSSVTASADPLTATISVQVFTGTLTSAASTTATG
jgi:Tfp pilus assembly protein PilO